MNFSNFLLTDSLQFSINNPIGRWHFSVLGPTPIHAPRPRPVTSSVCIRTSDFGHVTTDVETQMGSSPFELPSFLQDLSFNAASSPLRRPSVSALSPNFRQFLDGSHVVGSLPTTRVEPKCVDASTSGSVELKDKAVSAIVDCRDSAAGIDSAPVVALVEPPASPDQSAALVIAVDSPAVIPPSDAPTDDSSTGGSTVTVFGPTASASDSVVGETSTIGPSLLDSDDEPIASRLPGYLSNFKTCEVSGQQLL